MKRSKYIKRERFALKKKKKKKKEMEKKNGRITKRELERGATDQTEGEREQGSG